jgi:hypothetical protein
MDEKRNPTTEHAHNQSQIRLCAKSLERIDTHSHIADTVPDLQDQAETFEHFRTCDVQTVSRVAAIGCRELYGIDPGTYLRPDSPREIFDRAAELRAQGVAKSIEYALDRSNITCQLAFCDYRPECSPLLALSPRIRLLAYIDLVIAGDDFAFCPDGASQDFCYYDKLCERFGVLDRLDGYLDALDARVDSWRRYGVVGMKTALAYSIGLAFGNPSLEEARAAFRKKQNMNAQEIRLVHDYAFRHALLACQRNTFPVVIHTGFLIWGHAKLSQANPMLLHSLLVDPRYKNLTFVLLHGGNPYVGETTYLAGMFPNVIVDFTWISWVTRTRFRMALAEWLEVVPHDRLCWGSDSHSPETIVGIDWVVREEIANVLDELVQRDILNEKTALTFLENAYLKTPKRVFGL